MPVESLYILPVSSHDGRSSRAVQLGVAVFFFAAQTGMYEQARFYVLHALPTLLTPAETAERVTGRDAGRTAIGGSALGLIAVLDRTGERTYWASDRVRAEPYLWQRLVEGAWPRRPRPDARLRFVAAVDRVQGVGCAALPVGPLDCPGGGCRALVCR